ncbi:MAG: GAF domain-containing protein [Pseudonocardia sp.]
MTFAAGDGRQQRSAVGIVDGQAVVDPVERARLLARIRDAMLEGEAGARSGSPRPVVSESWRRSLAAHIDPDRADPPQVFGHDEVREIRRAHPLAEALPLLRHALVDVADEAMHMMIVTDADGHILWCEGQADVLRLAEPVGLTEGTRWAENAIGTNAMGTALASGKPVQIHSAEHLVRTYHSWTCAASPVRDPDTGCVIGVVDVTGPMRTFHPATIMLVSAAAKLAESQLQLQMVRRDERLLRCYAQHLSGAGRALVTPTGRVLTPDLDSDHTLPGRVDRPAPGLRVPLAGDVEGVLEPLVDGYLLTGGRPRTSDVPRLTLTFLGAARPRAQLGGRQLPLSQRHAEMVALLALHPDGLTAEQLATEVYGEDGNPITARAEVHRLRVQLGAAVVRAKPYRLHARVDADFLAVRRALREGRIRDAARAHRGPLLPRSECPGIREEREYLQATLRHAVLGRGDIEAQWTLAESPQGLDDAELTERLLRALPDGDPRGAILVARHERLHRE